MPRNTSFRSGTRTLVGSSDMVRVGDLTNALTNVLRGASANSESGVPNVGSEVPTNPAGRATPPTIVVDVSSQGKASRILNGIENQGLIRCPKQTQVNAEVVFQEENLIQEKRVIVPPQRES